MRSWFCIVGLLAIGCGGNGNSGNGNADLGSKGNGGSGSGGGAGGSGGDMALGPAADVKGTGTQVFIGDSAAQTQPIDFSKGNVEALVPDGAGNFTQIMGAGKADGTFTIPSVPSGARYIVYAPVGGIPQFRWTTADSVDFSSEVGGRPDGMRATSNTTLSFNVTNLNAWQVAADGSAEDQLELFSAGANMYLGPLDQLLTTSLASGATTVTGTTTDISVYGNDLIDGTKGDAATLTQLVHHALPDGTPYQALAKMLALGNTFTQTGGAATTISGAFTDVPQTQTFSAVFKRSQFQAYETAVNPTAACYEQVNVAALPGVATHGNEISSADLIWAYPATGTSDITFADVAYGNPYPAWYGVTATFMVNCRIDYTIGSATTAASLYPELSVSGPMASGNITPLVSPAVKPTIAGKDAFANNSGVGSSPTIAWQAPAIGTPTSAIIGIYHLGVTGTITNAQTIAVITVDGGITSVPLPPTLLTKGESYAFMLELLQGSEMSLQGIGSMASGSFKP